MVSQDFRFLRKEEFHSLGISKLLFVNLDNVSIVLRTEHSMKSIDVIKPNLGNPVIICQTHCVRRVRDSSGLYISTYMLLHDRLA